MDYELSESDSEEAGDTNKVHSNYNSRQKIKQGMAGECNSNYSIDRLDEPVTKPNEADDEDTLAPKPWLPRRNNYNTRAGEEEDILSDVANGTGPNIEMEGPSKVSYPDYGFYSATYQPNYTPENETTCGSNSCFEKNAHTSSKQSKDNQDHMKRTIAPIYRQEGVGNNSSCGLEIGADGSHRMTEGGGPSCLFEREKTFSRPSMERGENYSIIESDGDASNTENSNPSDKLSLLEDMTVPVERIESTWERSR